MPRENIWAKPAAPAGAQNELGGVHAACEGQQRPGDVVADDLVVGAAHVLDQGALSRQVRRDRRRRVRRCGPRGRRAGRRRGLRSAMRAARRMRVSPSGPPVSATTTRSRASQVPSMSWSRPVPVELLVDLVGQPQQRELAQGGEVADPEVVAQGGVDLVGLVDVAVRHPPAQRLGGHVDELDLFGGPDHLVGMVSCWVMPVICSTTSLRDSRCWMLTVVMTSMPASSSSSMSCQRFSWRRAGHVGVRQLVDQRDLRAPGEHRVEVHLGELGTPVGHLRRGTTSSPSSIAVVSGRSCGLDEPDDDVGARGLAPLPLLEHR